MDKEIHIYNYNDPKQSGGSSHGYFSRGQLLIVILAVLLSPSLAFLCLKQCSTNGDIPVADKKAQQIQVTEPVKLNTQSCQLPTTYVTPSGEIETTVTTSLIVSPYIWQYELKDVVTNDNFNVNVKLAVTSQIKDGMGKLLVQNYGGNWFYTVFVARFEDVVKSDVKGHYSINDLKMRMRGVEQQFTTIAQKIVDQLSEDILLPVDIKSVKVVEVN